MTQEPILTTTTDNPNSLLLGFQAIYSIKGVSEKQDILESYLKEKDKLANNRNITFSLDKVTVQDKVSYVIYAIKEDCNEEPCGVILGEVSLKSKDVESFEYAMKHTSHFEIMIIEKSKQTVYLDKDLYGNTKIVTPNTDEKDKFDSFIINKDLLGARLVLKKPSYEPVTQY